MRGHESAKVVSLADRLKRRRLELGLSQAQAARELDVARTAYRLWEMEAAKPQPDRWRLISRWLGVSVTTMLLADDLDGQAKGAVAFSELDRLDSTWSDTPDDPASYLATLRTLIEEGTEKGFLSPEHTEELLLVVARIDRDRAVDDDTPAWEPGRLDKHLRPGPRAPRKAREAVDFVAGDLPDVDLHNARLLVSELVTNSVRHGAGGNATIGLTVDTSRDRLRVEVTDGSAGSPELVDPSDDGGWGLMLVDRLASRWGSERESGGNVTWFEIDLPSPGARPERR